MSAMSRFACHAVRALLQITAHPARAARPRRMVTTRVTGGTWGVCMDIDGVVLRGKSIIDGSDEAIRMLQEAGVPFSFMTNGGGITEAKKAKQLQEYLGIAIDEDKVLLSHTPMRTLAKKFRNRRVVIVGSLETVAVAEHYGYDFAGGWAVTPAQIAAGTHGIYPPGYGRETGLPPVDINAAGQPPIEAVLLFYDPHDWALELQVLTDVLAGGHPVGAGLPQGSHAPWQQAAEVIASNPDFLWQASYPNPRYGQGAFVDCLRTLWRRRSHGAELRVDEFGKPHPSQFSVAEQMLQQQLPAGQKLQRIYMMGDNPAADIRGANIAHGGAWRSILVSTGVYRGGIGSNDAADPAWRVERDLRAAVERLLLASAAEHASH